MVSSCVSNEEVIKVIVISLIITLILTFNFSFVGLVMLDCLIMLSYKLRVMLLKFHWR